MGMKRSRDQFRWAREAWHQSERFTEPTFFHQLARSWEPVARRASPERAPRPMTRVKGLPLFWQKANPSPKFGEG